MGDEQRFSFDAVADLYDRVRPSYPEALFEDLVSLSGIQRGERILEIGCGTGQASTRLAERGFRMLCLEPGLQLASLAAERLASFRDVEVVPMTFEAWPTEKQAFALICSAQAFHWVDPEVRFRKAAAALRANGSLAVFGNAAVLAASPLREQLQKLYELHAPQLDGPSAENWYAQESEVRALFSQSRCFAAARWQKYPWSKSYTAAEYVSLLATYSDHVLLPEAPRERLLAAIRGCIADSGGAIEVHYEAHLYWARRS